MLKRACEPADSATAEALARDLVDTMRAHPGCVGIAAPQIGEAVRMAVIDVSGHRLTTSCNGLLLLINPTIRQAAGHRVAREGCLSLPTITADVGRALRIEVEAETGSRTVWSDGFEARAIQHEMDHLQGILILDRVTSVHALHPRMA
jgi:peptide deformylase